MDFKDIARRAAKTAVATFASLVTANALDFTNLATVKSAAIAAGAAAATYLLNVALTWATSDQ